MTPPLPPVPEAVQKALDAYRQSVRDCPEAESITAWRALDLRIREALAVEGQCSTCVVFEQMLGTAADRMNVMLAGDSTATGAAIADRLKRVFQALGFLLGSMGMSQAKIAEAAHAGMQRQNAPQAVFTTAVLDLIDVARAERRET